MNNKTLLYIFGALLLLYLGSRIFGGNKKSSFDPQVVAVDTARVTQINLFPKAEEGRQVSLTKRNGSWLAKMNDLEVPATSAQVKSVLAQMLDIKAKRVVSRSQENWPTYEVDAANGSRVQVLAGDKTVADFIVGAFKFDQATRSASSYMRSADGDEVYVVDGFMGMQFNQGFGAFRNKELVKFTREDLVQIELTSAGQDPIGLQNIDGDWFFAGMEELDSTKMAGYVTSLSNVFGSDFDDSFDAAATAPLKQLRLNLNNSTEPVTIACYPGNSTETPFILHSNLNEIGYFPSDSAGIYDRVFGKLEAILMER